jgi:hypothetical protein
VIGENNSHNAKLTQRSLPGAAGGAVGSPARIRSIERSPGKSHRQS